MVGRPLRSLFMMSRQGLAKPNGFRPVLKPSVILSYTCTAIYGFALYYIYTGPLKVPKVTVNFYRTKGKRGYQNFLGVILLPYKSAS